MSYGIVDDEAPDRSESFAVTTKLSLNATSTDCSKLASFVSDFS
jgi:hypothetical protein